MNNQLPIDLESTVPSMVFDYKPRTEVITIPDDEPQTTVVTAETAVERQMDEKKRKKPVRDENAPKAPLTGYLRFMTKHRETLRAAKPQLSFPEITKLLGVMWTELPATKKQIYLDEAETEKEVYMQELGIYQQSDIYKKFIAQQEAEKMRIAKEIAASQDEQLICRPCSKEFASVHNKKEHLAGKKHRFAVRKMTSPTAHVLPGLNVRQINRANTERNETIVIQDNPPAATVETTENKLNIPVFSQQFLDYNKDRESELRKLRKATIQCEEQNAILNKQNDNLKAAITKLEKEHTRCEENMNEMEPFLKKLRSIVVENFGDISLPGSTESALTGETVDGYLEQLCYVFKDGSNTRVIERVKDVASNLDYPDCVKSEAP